MALGTGGLGTLTLYINADTTDFDQAVSRIESKARSFGSRFDQTTRNLDLTPQVDDSQLTSLNKHLDLKQRHFQTVGQFMQRSPLQPKVRSEQLESLSAQLKEVSALHRQASREFNSAPLNLPRINISPRISNRTVNEAPRINTRITAPDFNLTQKVTPRVSVGSAQGSGSLEGTSDKLARVQSQAQRLDQTSIKVSLDTAPLEKFSNRISELETRLDRLAEKQEKVTKRQQGWGQIFKAVAGALPDAIGKISDGIGTGLSQGLSQAAPAFANKMGDATTQAVTTAISRAITPAIKINTPEIKFQTSFTDIAVAGKELVGAGLQLKGAAKEVQKTSKPSGIMGLLGKIGGGVVSGVGQSIGGRLSTGVVGGLEQKFDLQFRDASQAAVVALGESLEEALGIEFKEVGNFVRESVPEVFDKSNRYGRRGRAAAVDENQPNTSVENAVVYLASQDDGANAKDGKGFNKLDTRRGQKLADKIKSGQQLAQDEAKQALQMLQKYRKQLLAAQQGSLPEWDKIEAQYQSVATQKETPWSSGDESQQLMAQLEQLKSQLKASEGDGSSSAQIETQVKTIQKVESDLQSAIDRKRQDLIDAMMSAQQITMAELKPIGKELGLPRIDKAQKDGGYSKDELIKEIVGKSDPDALQKQLPFIPVPVSQEVVKESAARAQMNPRDIKASLGIKRGQVANAIAQKPGQKSGQELAEISNIIEREQQVINNLLSRNLSNSVKKQLKRQRKAMAGFSSSLANEAAVSTQGATPTQQPSPAAPASAQADIGDPWVDVDQMRSNAAATRSAFADIADIFGAFVDGISGYSQKLKQVFASVIQAINPVNLLDRLYHSDTSVGGDVATGSSDTDANIGASLFRGIENAVSGFRVATDPKVSVAKYIGESLYELAAPPSRPDSGYVPKKVNEGLPQDVSVQDREYDREYTHNTKSGHQLKVKIIYMGENSSGISFDVDNSADKHTSLSQREKDAIALKVARIAKHDAQTRSDGHRYNVKAHDADEYGAARAQAYERISGFTRPKYGMVGHDQFAVTRNGKMQPDTDRLAREEVFFPERILQANIGKISERAASERQQQKQKATVKQKTTQVATQKQPDPELLVEIPTPDEMQKQMMERLRQMREQKPVAVDQMRTRVAATRTVLDEINEVFDGFVVSLGQSSQKLKDIFSSFATIVNPQQLTETFKGLTKGMSAGLSAVEEVAGGVQKAAGRAGGISEGVVRAAAATSAATMISLDYKTTATPELANARKMVGAALEFIAPTSQPDSGYVPKKVDEKLPEGVSVEENESGRDYKYKTKSGHQLKVKVVSLDDNTSRIDFEVDGSVGKHKKLSQKEKDAIALKVARITKHDSQTRPDNYRYRVKAHDGDEYGAARAQAYERMSGFTRPKYGLAGFEQLAMTRGGKMQPDTASLMREETFFPQRIIQTNADNLVTTAEAQRDKQRAIAEAERERERKANALNEQAKIQNEQKSESYHQNLPEDVEGTESIISNDKGSKRYRFYRWQTESGRKAELTLANQRTEEELADGAVPETDVSFGTGTFGFGKLDDLEPEEREAATKRIKELIQHDAKTRSEGHRYGASYNSDAVAAMYSGEIGFSRPKYGDPSLFSQYGVVQGGAITADTQRLKTEESELGEEAQRGFTQEWEGRLQALRGGVPQEQPQAQVSVAVDQMRTSADMFAKLVSQAAQMSGVQVKQEDIPRLDVNDEHLRQVGARAQYNLKENKLIVSSDVEKFFEALRSGATNLDRYEEEVKDVAHELRHAFQYDFGRLNQGSLMGGAKSPAMQQFSQTSRKAQAYGTKEAGSEYYQQHAKQTSNPQAFLQVIRDTEADAENFAEQWKVLMQGALDIDDASLSAVASTAATEFVNSMVTIAQPQSQSSNTRDSQVSVSQNRGVPGRSTTGAVGGNRTLKRGLDVALDSFNSIFDVFSDFNANISQVTGAANTTHNQVGDTIHAIGNALEDLQIRIQQEANNLSQQGAGGTVDALDAIEAQLEAELQNIEKFFAYVNRKTGGRATSAINATQQQITSRVGAIRGGLGSIRDDALMQSGRFTPQVAPPPENLKGWRKILKNIREEIKAINDGEQLDVRMAQGAAADLGININQQQAASLVSDIDLRQVISGGQKAVGVTEAAITGNWKGMFDQLLDDINEFTDVALDRLAEFVEGIPGGQAFAKIIRGAKEFKGVVIGFVGLKAAWQGLVDVKKWLDSFDEVFVDAAIGFEKMMNIIGFSSKTFAQAQSNIKMVRDEAIRLRTDLKQSMQGFSTLSAASMDTGLEGEGTQQIFKGLNQSGAAYGLNAEEQNRVFVATGQMMSKNTVSSEELKQQLGEVMPGAFQAGARASGKTTQEFQKLLETGQILAEDFLPKFAQQLSAETAVGVAGAASSAQGATNKFNNSLLELQVSLGKFGIDERNLFLNAMAGLMDFAAKNAVILSYAMGSLLYGTIVSLKVAFVAFGKTLVSAVAKFAMTRLGISSLGASFLTLGKMVRASMTSFLILTVILDGFAMLHAAFKDSSGKSRDFADSTTKGFQEVQRSIAEARGELDAFYAAQGKKNPNDQSQKIRGQDSIIDEAPILNWLMPKEIDRDAGWFNKMRFGARETVASAADGVGQIFNPVATIKAIRENDRTLMPTYANKKFQDQKRATSEILDNATATTDASETAITDEELAKVKEYDEQLKQIQIKRRGIAQINPGDKEGLAELKRQEEDVLEKRAQSYKPLAATQASNQQVILALRAEVEVYKEKIAAAESDILAAPNKGDKKDIQARLDYYKKTLPSLEENLKKVETAQDNLGKAIGESVDKFILLQKQLQNVADRLSDANDSIQMIGNEAKLEISAAVASGDMTSGQAEAAKQSIDQDVLSEQFSRKQGAINEYKALLYGADAQAILESRGINDINNVGQAELGTLASNADNGTPEKEVLTRLQEVKKMELEASDLQVQLEGVKEQSKQQIKEANKQIADYFRDVSRQAAELALTTKEAQAQIALQEQKNKLKSALQGFQDNFFTSFVDSLIEGMDSMNEPLMAGIEKQRELQSASYAKQDRDRQTGEIAKSLPIDSQQIKLDFSSLDAAPVKELKSNLQASAEESKKVTAAAKDTGVAIAKSSDAAKDFDVNVEGVTKSTRQIESATDSVTTALQDNVAEAQAVGDEIYSNTEATSSHQVATQAVNDTVALQTVAINESANATLNSEAATAILQQTWGSVTSAVGETLAKTWEWFKGLASNVPFLQQFGDLIMGWSKNIGDLIGKTWEWFKGLADNMPFLQQIGQTIGGWGQGIGNAVGGAVDAAGNAVQGALGRGGGSPGGRFGYASPSAKQDWNKVLSGSVTAGQSLRASRGGGSRLHNGIDFDSTEGLTSNDLVNIMFPGKVETTKAWGRGARDTDGGESNAVRVRSELPGGGQFLVDYGHVKSKTVGVQQGQQVGAGQQLGRLSNDDSFSRGGHLDLKIQVPRSVAQQAGMAQGSAGKESGMVYVEVKQFMKWYQQQVDKMSATERGAATAQSGIGDALSSTTAPLQRTPQPSSGGGTLPKLRSGYTSIEKLGQSFAGNPAFDPSTPEGRARLTLVMATGGSEVYSKGSTATDFFTRRGGTGNNMLGALQYNRAYNLDKYNSPEKYVQHTGNIFSGKASLPNGRQGRDFGAALNQAIASGAVKSGKDLEGWMRKVGLGGSNWQGVDDGFHRVPGLTDDLVGWLQTGQGVAATGTGVQSTSTRGSTPAAAPITPKLVPFASMAPSYSGTTVNQGQLAAAQSESEKIAQEQKRQAAEKEKVRVETARVEGEQRQRKRLEQLRQSILDQDKNRTQLNRQFTSLGLDAQIQTPELTAKRERTGINEQFDDLKLANTEEVRKTQAGRDQAQQLLDTLTAPGYVAQPGQDVSKDIEGARQAIASADTYLADLTRVQNDIESQRQQHLQFQQEQTEREKKLREEQEKLATEAVDISVLEARLQKLKEMQGRGVRDQGVENIPQLEAEITARREEMQLKQQVAEIDEKIRANADNPTVVEELKKQKRGYEERLKIIRESIDANRAYSEEVAKRENERTAREASNAQATQELEILKQELAALQQASQVNPGGQASSQIPALQEAIALKELDLQLSNDLAAVDQERFEKKIDDEQYEKRVTAIKKENELTRENIELQRQQAELEHRRAAEDRAMSISGQMTGSRSSVLGSRASLLAGAGLDTQAKEYQKQAATIEQQQAHAQQSLDLERFIEQMQISNSQAVELRANLDAVNGMKMENIEQQFSTMNELMTGVQGSFESAFTSILDGSKSIGEAAMDFLKGVGSQLASMASKMITDELFGKILGKGNKNAAEEDAASIAGGGLFGGGAQNPLAQFNMMNPLPVVMTNASALGGGGGLGGVANATMGNTRGGGDFLSGIFGGGDVGFGAAGTFAPDKPLPVDMVSANDNVFSSLTNGIMGIFGGGGGAGGGIVGTLGSVAGSLFGGGGGAGGGMGGGFGSILSAGLSLFGGLFNSGGTVGETVKAYASGGNVGGGLGEELDSALKRERSMNGGRRARVIVATDGELVVPNKVADRLTPDQKAFLIGKSSAPSASKLNYATGGVVGSMMGNNISNSVKNMGGTTNIEGSTVNVGGEQGMKREEAARLKSMIDASVMDTIQKQKRARGLLY